MLKWLMPSGPDSRTDRIPSSLRPLSALARDLRWTWRPSIRALFSSLDPDTWKSVGGNPVAFLRRVPEERLHDAVNNASFLSHLFAVLSELSHEDSAEPLHPGARAMAARGDRIAYFAAEFGLTEVLPIYAGGLGVLAGDHLKSSSDLALPLSGVGLFYRHGYFRQALDREGQQQESEGDGDPADLPLFVAETPDGGDPVVSVELGDRTLRLLIRVATVGRVPLFLLDADLPENDPEEREITARLYSGDQETRIRQEIALGIGGLRALDRLRLRPTIRHINEGHATFVALEKIRQLVAEEGLSFSEAREIAAAGNVFTTHTPVPSGIDRFPPELVQKYLGGFARECGLTLEEFLRLGQEVPGRAHEPFSMPVLALRLCAHANAVSELHAKVSRRLWLELLPELADVDVRIRSITNGVHRATWTDPEVASLRIAEDSEEADQAEFWRVHERLRDRLVRLCRLRLAESKREQGASEEEVEEAGRVLDPRALTIGFARRFTAYKRATLIFSDPERLGRIMRDWPVQILFAGKAHPKDDPGKELLRNIHEFAAHPDFRGRVVLLPDYDMALARLLVAGCDVWLNNPIPPHEASGTSGMKAAMNGVLNLSVLDGWWDEAPSEEAGFVIGEAADESPVEQVAASLYEVLEQRVIPLFFDRDEKGVPWRWMKKMVFSAARIGRRFSSDRMVTEYLEFCYLPAAERQIALANGNRDRARALAGPASPERAGPR